MSNSDYPKYLASYCVMLPEAGANLFGHAFILISKMGSATSPVEVVNSYGYYSQPSSTTLWSPVSYIIKKIIGLDFDIQKTHSILIREKMRNLDLGVGLKAKHFEINKAKYEQLNKLCKDKLTEQEQVIEELNTILKSQGIKSTSGRQRYKLEKELALEQKREPRLLAFHWQLSFSLASVLSTENSITCKKNALNLLKGSIGENAELNQLKEPSNSDGAPRFSLKNAPSFLLYSQGPRHEYKKSHSIFNKWPNAEKDQAGSKLFFALPPKELINFNSLTDELRLKVETLVSQAIVLERAILNSPHHDRLASKKSLLVKQLQHSYKSFSKPETYKDNNTIIIKLSNIQNIIKSCQTIITTDQLDSYFTLQCYKYGADFMLYTNLLVAVVISLTAVVITMPVLLIISTNCLISFYSNRLSNSSKDALNILESSKQDNEIFNPITCQSEVHCH